MALALLSWLSLHSGVSFAEDVPGRLSELVDKESLSFERLEASGVSYFEGRLVVVDDTLNAFFVFDATGRMLARLDSSRLPTEQAKFEDIAFDAASGSFLAVGSHSGWDASRLDQWSVLYELRLRDAGTIDESSVHRLPLAPAFEKLGLWKPRGMKIEGLAVDDQGETVYVGLREPTDRARVYAVSLESLRRGDPTATLAVEFDAGFAAESEEKTPFCVSALEWDKRHGGLLITTSTEHEPSHRFLGNRLWFASPGKDPVMLMDRFDIGMKAEGVALGAGRLFIVYDNDQDDTAIPSRLRIVPLDVALAKLDVASIIATP